MKSKTTAYLLLFTLGIFGGHKFYLEKIGTGILYFFTLGFFFIGCIIDFFTLGDQVDAYNNALMGRNNSNANNNTNMNNIVINVPGSAVSAAPDISQQLQKLSELRNNGILTEEEFNAQKKKLLE
jgi:TM2 domain-containing membrane protein YozV